jgi:chromosomal replication initiation ATPase DnaA
MTDKAAQLVLALRHDPSLEEADFVAAPSNQAALAWIARYPDWPAPLLALHGPAGSGKTHLLHLWRRRAQAIMPNPGLLEVESLPQVLGHARAVALDVAGDEPAVDRRALLHLYNMMRDRGGHVLLASRQAPAHWRIDLPDLRSRLAAAPGVAIEPPDDQLLAAVLGKLFADRQLRPDQEVIDYLVPRIERSLAAAGRIVAALDRRALTLKRDITTALAREYLEETLSLWE